MATKPTDKMPNLTLTYNFSLDHYRTAKLLAEKVKEIECAHKGKELGEPYEKIRSYCSGTIISAAASIFGVSVKNTNR